MAKKKNNINAQRDALIQRTSAYEQAIKQSFANTVDKILKLNKTLPSLGQGEMFSFYSLNAKKQKEVESLFRELQSVVTFAIRKGIEIEWSTANNECDAFISSTFGRDLSKSKDVAAWYERNTDAMEAFINRSDNGLNLSDRIWKNVQQLRDEMEVAMTVSIGEGGSAATTSRKVRQYLNDPDLMFKRFRFKKGEEDVLDEDGNVIGKKTIWGKKWKKRIKDKETGKYKFIDYDRDSYKVGQGMYKSAARNAMRVARTETTMAYRQADHERWQQLDFVIGQEVKLSKNHPAEDICNMLAGQYPKDFNFCGWHPQCFCYVVPITLSTDESLKIANEIANGRDYEPLLNDLKKGKEIDTYPNGFTKWIEKNQAKIASSKSLPYFVKYNEDAVKEVLTKEEPKTKNVKLGSTNETKVSTLPKKESWTQKFFAAKTIEEQEPLLKQYAEYDSFGKSDVIKIHPMINNYSTSEWHHTYLSSNKSGCIITEKERFKEALASKAEIEKFVKELQMCVVIADNGHCVEYLQGVNRPQGQTYDIKIDGIKADLKCITGGSGNIVKYAKKALNIQGAESVVFEIPISDPKYFDALSEARRKCVGKIYFYVKDEKELKELIQKQGI